jgi:hypothetical protein
LDSRRGRSLTNIDWYDRLKQSPHRAGLSSINGTTNFSVKSFGRER